MVKAVEEVDAALVAAEAVNKAVVDSKAVAAFRDMAAFRDVTGSKAVDATKTVITAVAVAKVIATEIKVHSMEALRKDLIIQAIRAVAASTHIRLPHSPDNKVTRPARAFTMLLCLAQL